MIFARNTVFLSLIGKSNELSTDTNAVERLTLPMRSFLESKEAFTVRGIIAKTAGINIRAVSRK
jgi:hypothetical protein